MEIKQVNHNTIDVFTGIGWDFWGRFKIKFGKDKNELFQIKGNRLPKEDYTKLQEQYNAK